MFTASIIPLAAWYSRLTGTTFLGNTLLQWAGLLGLILVGLIAGRVVGYLVEKQAGRSRERMPMASLLMGCLSGPITMLTLSGALYVAGTLVMSLEPWIHAFYLRTCTTIAVLAVGWFIYRVVDVIELVLQRWTGRTETSLDDQLVPMVRKSLRVFVVIVIILFLAQNVFEWDIGALIAGLGIGGLAFALAAKDMLANLFGSVTIFADRPFTMGDRIQVAGKDGMVEEVGFRSTRIRTLDGHQVTIPNALLTNEAVENVGRRPSIRRIIEITVTYDTPPQKVRRGKEILEEILNARMEFYPEDLQPRVYFYNFNSASLGLVAYVWFTPPDWWAYCQFWNDVNMEILDRFNAEGIEFAFPTQTLYHKQDSEFEVSVKSADAE